jgi:hypothetical protein
MKLLFLVGGLLSVASGATAQLRSSANTNTSPRVLFYSSALTETPPASRISRREFRSKLPARARVRIVPSEYFQELYFSPWVEKRRELHLLDVRIQPLSLPSLE